MAELRDVYDVYRYGELVGKEVKLDVKWGDDLVPVLDAADGSIKPSHSLMVKEMKEKIAELTKQLQEEKALNAQLLEKLEAHYLPLPDGVTESEDINSITIEGNGSKEMHPVLKQDGDVIILPKGCWIVYGDGLNKDVKPDWSTAPEKYNWWAIDSNGASYWYKTKPRLVPELVAQWYLGEGDDVSSPAVQDKLRINMKGIDWKKTLMKRPGWRE